MPEELFYGNERHLAPFRVEEVGDPHWFEFEIVEDLAAPDGQLLTKNPSFCIYGSGASQVRYLGTYGERWEAAHGRVVLCGKQHQVQLKRSVYPQRVGVKAVLETVAAEHLIARNNGFIFHCSYIDIGGKAILFTAPSETGKSTQADLWHELRGAEIINGDRAAVRMIDGVAKAEGIPFAGSSQYCLNRSLPIAAIVYLGQAPVTTIRKMRGYEAFSKIWEGVSVNTWDRTDVELVSGAVKQVVETVPVYHMPCTPDESAVIALENAL